MIGWLLLITTAQAVDRETALDHAAEFATHVWTMTSANETGSCSSSYVSDYTAGTWVGIPYDWGGFVTTSEYDAYIADGYGAGSHSWHGVLSCTVGVDCSGFVSQAWETDTKYGTSTFYQVTSDIAVSDIKRSDALNDSGSHIVMFAYETDAGIPVHYETYGTVVLVDSDQGWSGFDGYQSIRYEDMVDGPSTGTASEPIEISAFPYEDLRWTAGAASDDIDVYSCAPTTDESGPEMIYHFEVAAGGKLNLTVSDDSGVDVDIHVLDALSGEACLDRDDSAIEIDLGPGEYWIVADTYVSGYEFPGPYLLSGTFTGTLGEYVPEDDSDEETTEEPSDEGDEGGETDESGGDDTGVSDSDLGETWTDDEDSFGTQSTDRPGQPVALSSLNQDGGCAHAPSPTWFTWPLLALAAILRRRS